MQNRIIRFRAWHKEEKKMYNISKIYYDDFGKLIGVTVVPKPNDFIEAKHIELLQSTGLKDKNGKEIFEGDVVVDHEISPSLENKRIIRNFIENGFFLLDGMRDYEHRKGVKGNKIFEVIGNIHENPELIKGGKQ